VPFSFCGGFFFTSACGAVAARAPEPACRRLAVGKAYIAESAGSIFGGAAYTLWLVDLRNQFCVAAAASLVAAVAAAFAAYRICGLRYRLRCAVPCTAAGMIIAALLGAGSFDALDGYSVEKRWNSFNKDIPLVISRDTKYQNISVGERDGLFSLYSNGHLSLSFPDPYQYAPLAHLIASEHPAPADILLIGGGMGGLIEELLRFPLARIDYVDLDPELIRMVAGLLPADRRGFLADKRLEIHLSDGRIFIKNTPRRYDVVFINVSDPSTAMINRYYTADLYREVSLVLKEGGVIGTRVTSSADLEGADVVNYGGSVYRTLKTTFPSVAVTPGTENFFFASAQGGVVTTDPAVLERRWRGSGVSSPYFSGVQFSQMLPAAWTAKTAGRLSASSGALNTDLRPVAYFYNLMLWGKFSGSAVTEALDAIAAMPAWVIAFAAAACIIARCALQRRSDPVRALRTNTLAAIMTTGMAGMSLEIALIFMFQNVYGYVYQKIGFIVAAFMVGITAGGLTMNGVLRSRGSSGAGERVRLLIAFEILILLFSLAVPPLVGRLAAASAASAASAAIETAFYGLVFLSGYLTGIEFPLAGSIYGMTGEKVERTAGMIDGLDCFGAAGGAFLTGVLLIPIYGLTGTCALMALLKAGCISLFLSGPAINERKAY
ncbi:MAG TPA: hypothetical protein P5287_07750, partial [bacterium]|nr:hypothetical protein [bacterium]